jgi:hypothetical protein
MTLIKVKKPARQGGSRSGADRNGRTTMLVRFALLILYSIFAAAAESTPDDYG